MHSSSHRRFGTDPSRWSNSELSELRPGLIAEESGEDGDSSSTESAGVEYPQKNQHRQRPHSFSTISEHPSGTDRTPGDVRIVIHRPDERPRSADGPSRPELEVPIPHYRLGTPQFNTEGSAALHSSVYTRTSWSDNPRSLSFLADNASTPPNIYIPDSFHPGRPSFAASMFSGAAPIDLSKGSGVTENSVVYEFKEPVEPSMFETLVSDMDDESVVRYIPGTRDISAATPARIVAQIASESFMDYELVSDFFLTFRSYLSATNLLSLLLARLQWAINRLQDDGRIIRIRTFAALRHWILNYFVDDFVPDYDLRARFCETINAMYDEVKARQGGGMSDLKILIDLKRCWQGKCSIFWDSMELASAYHNPHNAIFPGGVAVCANASRYPDTSGTAQNAAVDLPPSVSHGALAADASEATRPALRQHGRNASAATNRSDPISPVTPQSDQSLQVTSCSFPPKRLSIPGSSSKAPHPVPHMPVKPVTPQEAKHVSVIFAKHQQLRGHTHKRSGSFSDSVRDDRVHPSVLKSDQQENQAQEVVNAGRLIRGELFAPAESCVTMMAPASPPLTPSPSTSTLDRQSISHGSPKPGQPNSGMKTFIGSIRRALHNRNGGQSVSSLRPAVPGPSLRGRTSAVPLNIAFGSDLYRDRKLATLAKKPVRIDALCDQVLKQYREATGYGEAKETPGIASSTRLQEPLEGRGSNGATPTGHRPAEQWRSKSQTTAGSESIVIVDDTNMEMSGAGASGEPLADVDHPPGFVNVEDPMPTPRSSMSLRGPSLHQHRAADEYSLPLYYDHTGSRTDQGSNSIRFAEPSVQRRSFSDDRSIISRMRAVAPHSLRKYASFQSTISKRLSVDCETPMPINLRTHQFSFEKPINPSAGASGTGMLRRRPGGDLRKMRNNGDVDPGTFLSAPSCRSSMPESTVSRAETSASRPETTLITPNPNPRDLRRSHSQRERQDVKRSFEAAIARFAQIPDDEDGGVESTLLKLEGKWPGPSPTHESAGVDEDVSEKERQEQTWQQHYHRHVGKSYPDIRSKMYRSSLGESAAYGQLKGRLALPRPYSDSVVSESEESYCSIPLLERGLSDDSMKKPKSSRAISTKLARISSEETAELDSSHPSLDVVNKTDSMRAIPRGSTAPVSTTPRVSRQMNRRSALSSGSVSVIDEHEVEDRPSFESNNVRESTYRIPPHPLAHPPSPPMTIQNPRSLISCKTPLDPANPELSQAPPLTPDPSPRNRFLDHGRSVDVQQDVASKFESDRQQKPPLTLTGVDHVPFILSCESQVLAQQLTLVEMAALSEVDWRDLVDMRWSTNSPSTLSWVDFLYTQERRGIDLVVGRFNLMVRWVLSEIVLSQDMYERARTITKFIHTAVHAKRISNYATMLQITIALSSTDCSKLTKTWSLVAPEDKFLFRSMEALIQPVRNFHDLRVEMETSNLQEGCLPFVGMPSSSLPLPVSQKRGKLRLMYDTGLYIHDLTYNAQKPAQIMNQAGDPLVNFERYRTTARIVKNLLRLIDASSKYRFEPVPGIVERCLWIAALEEEEIQGRSERLE